jgi:cell division transport system ATP-binding protein
MITFSSVTKNFGTGAPALDNISFEVEPGEFVFLTGHSGSGKSTLLKLLTKEYTPSSGDVVFNGQSLNTLKGSQVHHHRRAIGVVFQDYRLLPDLNVWENVALALEIMGKKQEEIEERVTDLLALVQLTDKAYHFPAQLSGGEAQRIGIARALATAPSVLLADEPTGNLDPQNTLMIARLFDKIHDLGTTIFFATHDQAVLATLNHRKLHLEKGKLVSDSGKMHAPPTASAKMTAAAPATAPISVPLPAATPASTSASVPAPAPITVQKKKTRFALPKISLKGFSFLKKSPATPAIQSTSTEKSSAEFELAPKPSYPNNNTHKHPQTDAELVEMVIEIENLDNNPDPPHKKKHSHSNSKSEAFVKKGAL